MAEQSIVLLGCGDVGPFHEPMSTYSTLARPVIAAGDIRFAQCERIYSERGSREAHNSTRMSGALRPLRGHIHRQADGTCSAVSGRRVGGRAPTPPNVFTPIPARGRVTGGASRLRGARLGTRSRPRSLCERRVASAFPPKEGRSNLLPERAKNPHP